MFVQKMSHDVPAALLVAGGEGMGNIEQIVHAIETSLGADAQVSCIPNKTNLSLSINSS